MRVMVFYKASEGMAEGMASPTPEMLEAFKAMDDYTDELVAAGVFVAAAGLKNGPADAKRVALGGPAPTVTDGPFAETRELIAGFSIWEVKDMDDAMAWATRCPNPSGGPGEIEIRAFYEATDLAEFVTPEELANLREGERGRLGVA